MAHLSAVKRSTYDAGWMRWGWPERVGGFGGSTLLRAYLGEALAARDLVEPGIYSMTEVLAPTMLDFASPELAATMVPRLLRGDETWCQGFSEPGTGSNLASLSCRATRIDDGWQVTGQKVWTSLAQYAQRCVLLTRTGTPESAHRGITALFVDMDSPGITVRPIETMHEKEEFCEVFFDDVRVPVDRMLGEEGQGWAVAMDLLPYERSTALWHRGAFLHRRLQQFLDEVPDDAVTADEVGTVFQQLFAFRARSRATQYRMHAGEKLGAETSVDKILVAASEQAVFDLARHGSGRTDARRRRRRERPMAVGLPVLACGDDLRRERRDPTQHRRPSAPRSRCRSMIVGSERELLAQVLTRATAGATGAALDAVLRDLGWHDALAVDAPTAISLLFESQGRAGATSSALDAVLANALGGEVSTDVAVVLPPIGSHFRARPVDGRRCRGARPRHARSPARTGRPRRLRPTAASRSRRRT